jgi:hypothetical protein
VGFCHVVNQLQKHGLKFATTLMEESDDGTCFSRGGLLKSLENLDAFEIGWSLKEIDFEGTGIILS